METQYIISIEQDNDSENPRAIFDSFGTLYTWNPRYAIGCAGDIYNENPHEFIEFLAFHVLHMKANANSVEIIDEIRENICMVPVYIYDHSGITIQTTPFSCPWDSGQIGWIYVTKDKCIQENVEFKHAEELLKSEIEQLNQYLTGDVWGYTIYSREVEDGNEDLVFIEGTVKNAIQQESYWGYYGYDYCKQEAFDIANWYVKNKQEIASEAA